MFEQMITLDAIPRLQAQIFGIPELVIVQVRSGAARAVAGHARFAAVGIEDANRKVGIAIGRWLNNRNPISARTVMAITDPMREAAQVSDFRQLISFENQIVVAVAVEFREMHFGVRCDRRFLVQLRSLSLWERVRVRAY